MKILIIEDDANLVSIIKAGLEDNGYAVDWVADGQDGVDMAATYAYDAVILDIMLPRKDGFAVCKEIRLKNVQCPVLMLTSRYREDDKVRGLDCGADDYLVKPFSYPELYARIRSLIRRSSNNLHPEIKIGDLTVYSTLKKVTYKGIDVELTAKEYAILEYLVLNRNGVVTREMLEEHIWDCEHSTFSNVMDALVSKIRKKIDPDNREAIIKTVKGLGYVIKE
jgi:DNA-binding response OmpR family regulator